MPSPKQAPRVRPVPERAQALLGQEPPTQVPVREPLPAPQGQEPRVQAPLGQAPTGREPLPARPHPRHTPDLLLGTAQARKAPPPLSYPILTI